MDEAGELVLLEDQDRSLWDRHLIARGMRHLHLSGGGAELSPFHLEAEISAVYSTAQDFSSTDWERILECYVLLQEISFSPVAELNRIVVVGRVRGAEAGLSQLDSSNAQHDLGRYNLLHITRGHLLAELGRATDAALAFEQALKLTHNNAVRRFIRRKMAELEVTA